MFPNHTLMSDIVCNLNPGRMKECALDLLPVEILHMILSYLLAGDIGEAFHNVSEYIDAILHSYDQYSCNLKAISKANFELICQLIRPEQIVSLTLSDGKRTPGLINIFLGQYQFEQFTRIRSVRLHQIKEENLLKDVIKSLMKLKQLDILLIDKCFALQRWTLYLSQLPPLTRISISRSGGFMGFSSVCVNQLEYVDCKFDGYSDLSYLCQEMSSLRELRARFQPIWSSGMLSPIVSPHLIRLDLEFQSLGPLGDLLQFSTIERLLSSLYSQLLHLTLNIGRAAEDLVDGYRWKELLNKFIRLRTFDFLFSFFYDNTIDVTSERVRAFQSIFVYCKRKWFVAANRLSIFTIPRFSLSKIELFSRPALPLVWTTAPDMETFYENTKTALFDMNVLRECQNTKLVYYKNVEAICCSSSAVNILQPTVDLPTLMERSFDLSRVTALRVEGIFIWTPLDFLRLILPLTHLKNLAFPFSPKLLLGLPLLPQIRNLVLYIRKEDEPHFHNNLDDLCRVFHRTEHLQLPICVSQDIVSYLIYHMKHLGSIILPLGSYYWISGEMNHWFPTNSISCTVIEQVHVGFWINNSEHRFENEVRHSNKGKRKCLKCTLL